MNCEPVHSGSHNFHGLVKLSMSVTGRMAVSIVVLKFFRVPGNIFQVASEFKLGLPVFQRNFSLGKFDHVIL